jgi:hypothetical protein
MCLPAALNADVSNAAPIAGPSNTGTDNSIPSITYATDGSPRLPIIDLKVVVPFIITNLLEAFITAAWRK